MVVCSGSKPGYGGGGTTYGSVFVTPQLSSYLTSTGDGRKLMSHEAKHADQWAVGGLGFGIAYVGTYAASGRCNMFERMANFGDGQYSSCHEKCAAPSGRNRPGAAHSRDIGV